MTAKHQKHSTYATYERTFLKQLLGKKNLNLRK